MDLILFVFAVFFFLKKNSTRNNQFCTKMFAFWDKATSRDDNINMDFNADPTIKFESIISSVNLIILIIKLLYVFIIYN